VISQDFSGYVVFNSNILRKITVELQKISRLRRSRKRLKQLQKYIDHGVSYRRTATPSYVLPIVDSISLGLFDCCVDSKGKKRKGKKRTSVLGLYEATDILLLLMHATIYHFDATLKWKSTMTATLTASYVRSILQTSCTVKKWRGGSKCRGKAKTQNNYLSHFIFNNKKQTQQQQQQHHVRIATIHNCTNNKSTTFRGCSCIGC
jgi:hypothetical protein